VIKKLTLGNGAVVNLAVGTFVPDRWIVRESCTHRILGSLFAATRPGGGDLGV